MMNKFVRMFGTLILAFSVVNVVKAEPFTAQVFDDSISLNELKEVLEKDAFIKVHDMDPDSNSLFVSLGNAPIWDGLSSKQASPIMVMLYDQKLILATPTKESVCDAVNNGQIESVLSISKTNRGCIAKQVILLIGGITAYNIQVNVANFIGNAFPLTK